MHSLGVLRPVRYSTGQSTSRLASVHCSLVHCMYLHGWARREGVYKDFVLIFSEGRARGALIPAEPSFEGGVCCTALYYSYPLLLRGGDCY